MIDLEFILRDCGGDMKRAEARINRTITQASERIRDLTRAIEKYRECRHASVKCFCTKEARAALGEAEPLRAKG